MARKPQPAAKAAPSQGVGVNKWVVLIILGALIPFSLPAATILGATMLPTLAAYFSERGNGRYAWLCVGGLNFAGVVPSLFSLWFGVNTPDEAFRLLEDGGVLLWGYGCAGMGWLLYKAMPPLVGSWLSFSTQSRVAMLKAAQRKLIDEWGDEVGRKPQPPGQ